MLKALTPALAVLALGAHPVAAQFSHPAYGFAAGMTAPTGQFHSGLRGEGFSKGLEGLAFLALALPVHSLGLRVDATVSQNSANSALKTAVEAALGGTGGKERVTRLGGNVDLVYQLPVGSRARPYVLGGIGIYHTTVAVEAGIKTSSTETKLGWNAGGGLQYHLRTLSLFLEGRLVNVSPLYGLPRMTFIPILFGFRFGGR